MSFGNIRQGYGDSWLADMGGSTYSGRGGSKEDFMGIEGDNREADMMNSLMGMAGKGDPVLSSGGDYKYFPFIPRDSTRNVDKHHMKTAKLKGPASPLMMMWNPFNPERWDDTEPMQTGHTVGLFGRNGYKQ